VSELGFVAGGGPLIAAGAMQVEPDSEALKEGVQQAKDAINAAKARYEEYWGKSVDAQ
jgi:hypothetical protein